MEFNWNSTLKLKLGFNQIELEQLSLLNLNNLVLININFNEFINFIKWNTHQIEWNWLNWTSKFEI